MSFYNPVTFHSATIANTETVSENVNLGGFRAFGIIVPTTAGANLTFEVSNDGSTWYDLYKNDNTQMTLAVTDATYIGLGDLISYFAPWQYVRITSDVAASGDEEFQIVARDL